MLVDSHCHLHDPEFPLPIDEVFKKCHDNAVDKVIVIGTSSADSVNACNFAQQHEEAFWTYGYHPEEFDGGKDKLEQELKATKEYFSKPKLVGIGEVGLDYHFSPTDKISQIFLLESMLQIAQDLKLPVSFHVRDAFEDFWPVFDNFKLPPSVLHSYTDSEENIKQALKRDLYFGVNGIATFAKISHPPLERILLETDAPFLTPAPFRGKINESAYILQIAEWAAEYYKVSLDKVADITTKNAEFIYKI
jgi:TatD DNase family protein